MVVRFCENLSNYNSHFPADFLSLLGVLTGSSTQVQLSKVRKNDLTYSLHHCCEATSINDADKEYKVLQQELQRSMADSTAINRSRQKVSCYVTEIGFFIFTEQHHQ